MARVLAIDYGRKRVGLAVTDRLQIAISGLDTVARDELEDFIEDYLLSQDVERIVLGRPSHPDGQALPIQDSINQFVIWLSEQYPDLDIVFEDENNSSVEAMQAMIDYGIPKMKRRIKENLDQMSAIIILQRNLGIR